MVLICALVVDCDFRVSTSTCETKNSVVVTCNGHAQGDGGHNSTRKVKVYEKLSTYEDTPNNDVLDSMLENDHASFLPSLVALFKKKKVEFGASYEPFEQAMGQFLSIQSC